MIGRLAPASPKFLSIRSAAASPLAWVLAAQCCLHLVGIGWGLPASDGWDNDGVAPRDFLAGVVETFSPGHYFRYPPVHLLLLTGLTSPVSIIALARARSLSPVDVISEITRVPYMTVLAAVARTVSAVMAVGLVWALAKTAEEIRGKSAGLWTAALAGVCVPFIYYAQTSNLDVPYLFWACLAVLSAVRAVGRGDARLLRRVGVFAALSVGTKDQAYALFAIAAPVAILLWMGVETSAAGRRRRTVGVEALRACASGVAMLVVIDGPLYNPRGFFRRAAYLLGPASQPFAEYTDDWSGRTQALTDVVRRFGSLYPAAFAVPVLLGGALLVRDLRSEPRRLLAGLLPLLVAVSFTLAFNCVARRTDHRFVLPQGAMLSIYGGVGLDALARGIRPWLARWTARIAVGAAFGQGVLAALDVDANLLLDPRYDAEGWLRTHVREGDAVETYGLNVYLPRFPPAARVRRVGPEPLLGRSPLPGVEEVVAAYGDAPARAARVLVVPEAWAGRYLSQGRAGEGDAGDYFRRLRQGQVGGYRLAYTARWDHAWWPPLDIHASTSREVWIYERSEGSEHGEPVE